MPLRTGVAVLLGGVVVSLVGGGLLFAGCSMRGRAAEAATWPTVEGTVTRSEVTTGTSSTGTGARRRSTTMYSPAVSYAYKVDGRPFEGDRLGPSGSWSSSDMSEARAEAGRYPVGSKVRVHVNPTDPRDACLQIEVGPLPTILIAAGGVVLFIGLAVTGLRILRRGLA